MRSERSPGPEYHDIGVRMSLFIAWTDPISSRLLELGDDEVGHLGRNAIKMAMTCRERELSDDDLYAGYVLMNVQAPNNRMAFVHHSTVGKAQTMGYSRLIDEVVRRIERSAGHTANRRDRRARRRHGR